MGLESISEPDDLNMDLEDDDENEVGGDDGADEGEEEFFDTRSASASTSSASGEQGDASDRSRKSKGDDADVDTEDDPVGPITPGPHSRFSIEQQYPLGQADKVKESDKVSEDPGDIEDDWVDPSVPSSPACVTDELSETSDSQAPKTTNDPIPSLSTTSNGGLNNKSNSRKNRNKIREVPIPVPRSVVVVPSREQHYPFPVAEDASSPEPRDRSRTSSTANKGVGPAGKRMHTARARDGGRTQSGGVKGILTDD